MKYPKQVKEAVRNAYIYEQTSLEDVAKRFTITLPTVKKWKKDAQKKGDNWDELRQKHSPLPGDLEQIGKNTLSSYLVQHAALMDEINEDENYSTEKKVTLLASLANSFAKTVDASKKALPKTNELAVALEVLHSLAAYIQTKFPQHQTAFLEILEPFGESLSKKN